MRGLSRSTYAVLSFNWSPSFEFLVFRGDNHYEDSVFSHLLTSSRIDSIRTSQSLDCLILFCMSFQYFEILFFLPPSKMIELSFIFNVLMFLLMSMGISIIKDHSFHHPAPWYSLQLVIGVDKACYCGYALFQLIFVEVKLLKCGCGGNLLHLQSLSDGRLL